jgi:hypothetical protein
LGDEDKTREGVRVEGYEYGAIFSLFLLCVVQVIVLFFLLFSSVDLGSSCPDTLEQPITVAIHGHPWTVSSLSCYNILEWFNPATGTCLWL